MKASLTAAVAMLVVSCGRQGPPLRLSEWKILEAPRAIRYELRTPLFSDYADKDRIVLMPQGTQATFNEFAVYDFPVGTVIAKTFSFRGRRIETRLLVHEKSGWTGLPYVWNQQQTEAYFESVPDPVPIEYKHASSGETLRFEYNIPNSNQCKGCHENAGVIKPIGPKARHLDAEATRLLTGVAGVAPAPLATLDQRARAYLDINCAHCHNTKGPANASGLVLTYGEGDAGVCKTPVAAGQGSGNLRYSIMPGRPAESILLFRMESTMPKIQMPELGRSIVHREGVELIRAWIAAMPASGCASLL